jgi:hypothetical protein
MPLIRPDTPGRRDAARRLYRDAVWSSTTTPRPLAGWGGVYGAAMVLPIDQRDALRMLAGSPLGSTEAIMMAHGFAIGTMQELVRIGFATAERRTVRAGHRRIEVTWLAVTDAGRRALGG